MIDQAPRQIVGAPIHVSRPKHMRFLIVNTFTGLEAGPHSSAEVGREDGEKITALLHDGDVEKAWVLHGGGHALIMNAESCEELTSTLRSKSLCQIGSTQVIPVMDAFEFFNAAGNERACLQRSGSGGRNEKHTTP